MTTLAPTNPVRFCIARLRQSIAEPSRYTDDDLLGFINDGYASACENTACLPAITTVIITAGTSEAALPEDWSRTIRVYRSGVDLASTGYQDALSGLCNGFYQYGSTIGITDPSTSGDSVLWLLYARTPAALGLDDVPEWGAEWNYLLRHYAAWRCLLGAAGSQELSMIVSERALYDAGVDQLRRETNIAAKASTHLVETMLGAS